MESLLDKFTRKLNIKVLPEIKNYKGIDNEKCCLKYKGFEYI